MRNAATNVREAIVPAAGHWLMEENPTFTVALIRDFLSGNQSPGERRIAPTVRRKLLRFREAPPPQSNHGANSTSLDLFVHARSAVRGSLHAESLRHTNSLHSCFV